MYQHFILVASSYARGERVGFHLATEGQLDHVAIEEKMQRLSHINRDDVGVHSFVTDSADWQSVIELDSFFEDIMVCQDFDEFEQVLQSDSKISAIDVAKFFLAMRPLSHLQLQKLVYLAYKTYLLAYGESLFDEKIVAFQYGPVVEEVYHSFKKYGSEVIDIDDHTEYILKDIHLPQALGRMLLVEDAKKIVPVLLDIVKQYGDLTGGELVKLTHSEKGPWQTVFRPQLNCEITDEVILAQGRYERLSS
ncbi:Panacea domain-containing protein [Streptococcus equi]|uniref:Panacea domain-containing protein n=1 Tax=Streptococcus equi TaxID=1336 RepID=UPI0005BC2733|nr:type II toxin-antitoxin system antitoxin SocA domain-containing protein [Streptococcus equi]KIS05352.1 phage protein [Streptococcus equi subsp. zooepidemicus Sz5]